MSDINDQDRNFLSHDDWFRYSAYPVAPLVDPDPLLRLQLELPEEEGGREGDKGQAVHRGGRGRQEVNRRSTGGQALGLGLLKHFFKFFCFLGVEC